MRGKVAVVTGGGGGIGRSLAFAFAGEGMHVVVADIEEGLAEAVAREVRSKGVKALAVKTDVADRASVEALAQRTYAELGGAHVVCNNAGVVTFKLAQDMSEADWDWILGVDLYGVIHGIEAFLPRMLASGEAGHFVNTASIAGLLPGATPGIVSYTTAKYGVVGLSEALRWDLADTNIGVSVLCPGGVRSRIVEAGRNRPLKYGGPQPPGRVEGVSVPQEIIDPDLVAQLTVQAVRGNQLYILTHPETQPATEARFRDLLRAYDELADEKRGLSPGDSGMSELAGMTAVVTGGGSGIGRGICLALADEGMNIVIADVDMNSAESVAVEVRHKGPRAVAVHTDVADRASVRRLADRAFAEFGDVRVLCNNAGVVTFGNAAQIRDSDWSWVMGVNLDGVVNGITQFLPRMLAAGTPAHIVNTASIAGIFPAVDIAPYVTSKYAVVGLSEHLRLDLAPVNIGVSVLCPGGVRTGIVHSGRNRPDALGGPEAPPADIAASGGGTYDGLDPLDVGKRVAVAIRRNNLYIVTHPETRARVEDRLERIRVAFKRAAATGA
jgi:NAD(P)-dependent dehydrogenase (short-subunit alcohol dehydrogenase family)